MFSKQQPEAIPGDVVGEALVEVRERIKMYGWRSGGETTGQHDPMCLGNHIGVVVDKKGKWDIDFRRLWNECPHWMGLWTFLNNNDLGRRLIYTLGFPDVSYLTSWNDHYYFFFGRWCGKRASLRRINTALEAHNAAINRRRRKKEQIIKNMDIGKPVREIEAPAPVELPIEEPEVEKEPEREPDKVPA